MAETRDAAFWIDRLDLDAHREGGYYARTYESDVVVDGERVPGGVDGDRPTASSIHYLVRDDQCSAFHRIDADELWHFYHGDPLRLYVLDEDLETVVLGRDRFRAVAPQGTWFAAEVASDLVDGAGHGYSLVGCDVTPAYDDAAHELADESLAEEYEAHREVIERLTP